MIPQTFPMLLYLHTRNNQILEVKKACEQRLSSVYHVWTMHRGILWIHIFSTYMYWLLTCLILLDMLCSQTMHVSTSIVTNSKRRGALKEYQSLCSIVYKCWATLIPENMEKLSLRYWVEYQLQCNTSIENDYGDYLRGVSVSTFVCAGSHYTGNELEKCLIALYLHFSPTWACSVCMQVG